jgi:hypothetical protein
MGHRFHCLHVLALFLALAAPLAAAAGEPGSAAIAELKAAFVYNFLQFTTWAAAPGGAATADLVLCAYARGAVADALVGLDDKPVGPRRIRVRAWPDSARDCAVLYLSAETRPRAALILAAAGATALTIAEDTKAPPEGVSIGLFEEGDRLAFAINLDSARNSGVRFSSKLLRLAKSVHPPPEDEP